VTENPERDYGAEVAAQYRLARSESPQVGADELVAVIVARLDQDALLALAADMLIHWPAEPPGTRRQMAEQVVFNFVVTTESDIDDGGPDVSHRLTTQVTLAEGYRYVSDVLRMAPRVGRRRAPRRRGPAGRQPRYGGAECRLVNPAFAPA
jgi:hypothetical protein